MPKTDDLVLFAQVVEYGSFSKVAEINSLTNSVVSKRVKKLEEGLGVQLLYRTTRKLTLTDAGRTLYQGAKTVKQAADEAFDAVAGLGEAITGQIKISVPTISGELLLAEAVAEFCGQYPGLNIDMSLNNRFVDLIDEGFDLVIRTGTWKTRVLSLAIFSILSGSYVQHQAILLATAGLSTPLSLNSITACNTRIRPQVRVIGSLKARVKIKSSK